MRQKIEMTGRRFGLLVVIGEAGTYRGRYCWECRCDCGGAARATGDNLRRGNSQSCGCKAKERIGRVNLSHGRSGTPAHRAWKAMRQRCGNPNRPDWERYGGRGITVCERWNSFEAFLADMGEPPDGMSLDRIDNDRGYEPGNCRWATARQQGRNQRKSVIVTFRGETLPLMEWSERTGMPYTTLQSRIYRGWPLERAFSEPVRSSR